MKIPEPTMPPITIMVASKNPSWRRSWGAGKLHKVARWKADFVRPLGTPGSP
jgi:hypothetical protein